MPDKKRVVHLIESLGNGGCENMLLRTLPLLPEFEHRIITLREPGELALRFENAGISLRSIGQRSLLDMASYGRLLHEVRQYHPQVILTYLFRADLVGRLFLRTRVSEPVIPFLRTTYNNWRYAPARLFEKLTKHLVPRYLANSEAVKNYYEKRIRIPKGRIEVLPNGVDMGAYAAHDREEVRRGLSVAEDDTVIVCVANLHPNKGHRDLLEAFRALSPEHQGLRLILVGDGTERTHLEDQAARLGIADKVRFLGKRDDVPELLAASDIFVLPTFFEGLSNALLEAMASGLPCVATDIPENRQLITDGLNGILFPPRNPSALARQVSSLLREKGLRVRLGSEARKFVQEHYSLQHVATLWKDYLQHI